MILTHIRISKPVHKIGQYSDVHKFACAYLKIKHNQLSNGALYRKMMQYGIKLSTKRPSETNNNFENCYLKSLFTIFQLRFKIFCYQNNIGIKYFSDIQNDVVVNFNDDIRIGHCALNIEAK